MYNLQPVSVIIHRAELAQRVVRAAKAEGARNAPSRCQRPLDRAQPSVTRGQDLSPTCAAAILPGTSHAGVRRAGSAAHRTDSLFRPSRRDCVGSCARSAAAAAPVIGGQPVFGHVQVDPVTRSMRARLACTASSASQHPLVGSGLPTLLIPQLATARDGSCPRRALFGVALAASIVLRAQTRDTSSSPSESIVLMHCMTLDFLVHDRLRSQ